MITVTISGTLGTNGWYRSNVSVNWQVEGETSSSGCDTRHLTADSPLEQITCSAENQDDGTSASQTVRIKIDKTPPSATAAADRPPDANGWYNHALTVASRGTDATSGITSCTSTTYVGPDSASTTAVGGCTDAAGNTSGTALSFKYDATAPTLFAVAVKAGNRRADVTWRKSNDTKVVQVTRAPGRQAQGESVVYRGSQAGFRDTRLVVGRKYQYRIMASDEAANRVERAVAFTATGALLRPAPGERITAPPMLVWSTAKRATYYNVQLIRAGRKVFSAWPSRPSYRLRRTWSYEGRRYRLRPGRYRWYVWPGFGPLSAGRFGDKPLGSSTFVVTK